MPAAAPAALTRINDEGAARRQHRIKVHFRGGELGRAAAPLDEDIATVAVDACRLAICGNHARQQDKKSQTKFHILIGSTATRE
jgi:hypothetical protein